MAAVETDEAWERRVAELWASTDEDDLLERMEVLAAQLPPGNANALFERASAFDFAGQPDRAVPLYRAALAAGLAGDRRRPATIQLASSLRNLGHPEETVSLLRSELEVGSDELDGAVRTFLALGLTDMGREREAVSVAVTALADYLPRYNRAVARYAQALLTAET